MSSFKYVAAYPLFYPAKQDAEGKSLMAQDGVVVDWDLNPNAAVWVETDEAPTWGGAPAPAAEPELPTPDAPESAPPLPEPLAEVTPVPPAPAPELQEPEPPAPKPLFPGYQPPAQPFSR